MNISRAFLNMLAMLAMMLASLAHAQTNSRPSSITFLDTVYSLAWGPVLGWATVYWEAVYLPEGESLPNYTNMLRVEHNPDWSVREAEDRQSQFLNNVRNSNNASVKILTMIDDAIDDDDEMRTGEILLVFLLVMEEDGIAKWTWSAYRYMPIQTTADGKWEGARLFDHSRQYVGNDKEGIERFLAEVGDKQAERINALTKLQIP